MIVEIEMKGEGGREVGREGIEEKGWDTSELYRYFPFYHSPVATPPGLSSDQVCRVIGTAYPQPDMLEKVNMNRILYCVVVMFCFDRWSVEYWNSW